MRLKLSSLPAPSFEALAKAALLPDPFPLQAIIASGTQAADLDPLFDNGFLAEDEDGNTSLSDVGDREVILQQVTWSAKRKLALDLAETYVSLKASPTDIAELFLKAKDHSAARRYFLAAAETDCRAKDYRSALSSLHAAFEIWPIDEETEQRKRALKEMARCSGNCLDHGTTTLALEELLEMAIREGSVEDQIDLCKRLAHAAVSNGNHRKARQRLSEGAHLADKAGKKAVSAQLNRQLAQSQGDALSIREALETLKAVRDSARQLEDWSLLSDTLAYAAMLTAMLGRISEANTMLEEALAVAIERDLSEQITVAYRRQANINEYASRYEAYRDSELAALDRCRTLDQKSGTQACLSCVSYAFFRLGQYQDSLQAIQEAVEELKVEGELLAAALCVKQCIHALQTSSQDRFADLEEAIRFNRIHGGIVFEFYVLWAMGANAVLTLQDAQASDAFHRLAALWEETDDHKDVVPGLLCAAAFHSNKNKASELSHCIDILNSISQLSESPEPRFGLLAATAEDAWLRGQTDLATSRYAKAIEGYRSLQLPFEQAWAGWRYGYILSQAGKDAEAVVAWKNAEEIAKRHSLRPLAKRIARDRSAQQSDGLEATFLTARQIEVARLISAGNSNKETAALLSISPRTVEMHVASLIERLGCRTRAEAASKAAQLGLI